MPYVTIDIDLDEIDDDDLIDEMKARGYLVHKEGTPAPAISDLDHVEHLALCGLMADARAEALKIVGAAIGRAIH